MRSIKLKYAYDFFKKRKRYKTLIEVKSIVFRISEKTDLEIYNTGKGIISFHFVTKINNGKLLCNKNGVNN